jgi:hypothetical protein
VIGTEINDATQDRLAPWQRMSHYRHTQALGIESGLHRSLTLLSFRVKHYLPFYPLSFLIPPQLAEFRAAAARIPIWIEKPARSSCGRGIRIVSGVPDDFVCSHVLMQEYIQNPLLIHGFKFDLRFCVCVPSVNSLRIYVYTDGLVRLAAEPYYPSFDDFENLCAHLTNFSINKTASEFKVTYEARADGTGSKWSFEPFWPFLESIEYDPAKMKRDVEDAIVIVVMSGRKELLRQRNHGCSFKMYGFDIFLDADGDIHVLEAIISPALGATSGLDRQVNTPLVKDFLNVSLIPKRSACSERVEEVFKKAELRGCAKFISVVDLEMSELHRGGFERSYPFWQGRFTRCLSRTSNGS